MKRILLLASFALVSSVSIAQEQEEITRLLQQYVAIDTSNPPGDTTKAAAFLTSILEKEGIPVIRYESAPGKVIVMRTIADETGVKLNNLA